MTAHTSEGFPFPVRIPPAGKNMSPRNGTSHNMGLLHDCFMTLQAKLIAGLPEERLVGTGMGEVAAHAHSPCNWSVLIFFRKPVLGMALKTELGGFGGKAPLCPGELMWNIRGIHSLMTASAAHMHRSMDNLSFGQILMTVQTIDVLSRYRGIGRENYSRSKKHMKKLQSCYAHRHIIPFQHGYLYHRISPRSN